MWTVEQTAQALKRCHHLLAGDTGLVHVAEALSVPVHVLYGPTRPELGFGPFLKESRAIYSNVICSPCNKDGRRCLRGGTYLCWKKLSVDEALAQEMV